MHADATASQSTVPVGRPAPAFRPRDGRGRLGLRLRRRRARRRGAARGAGGDRERRGGRAPRHDPRQPRGRLPRRRVPADRLRGRRAAPQHRDPGRALLRHRGRRLAQTAAASPSTSTAPRTPQAVGSPWRARARRTCTPSASSSICPPPATTATTRPSPGRPRRAARAVRPRAAAAGPMRARAPLERCSRGGGGEGPPPRDLASPLPPGGHDASSLEPCAPGRDTVWGRAPHTRAEWRSRLQCRRAR